MSVPRELNLPLSFADGYMQTFDASGVIGEVIKKYGRRVLK
jgi:hypothetical protein